MAIRLHTRIALLTLALLALAWTPVSAQDAGGEDAPKPEQPAEPDAGNEEAEQDDAAPDEKKKGGIEIEHGDGKQDQDQAPAQGQYVTIKSVDDLEDAPLDSERIHFYYGESGLGDAHLRKLVRFKSLSGLTIMPQGMRPAETFSEITEKGLEELLEETPNLEQLSLHFPNPNEIFKVIGKLEKLKMLGLEVDVSFDDGDGKYLKELEDLENLTIFHLHGALAIGDDTLKAIAKLEHLTVLAIDGGRLERGMWDMPGMGPRAGMGPGMPGGMPHMGMFRNDRVKGKGMSKWDDLEHLTTLQISNFEKLQDRDFGRAIKSMYGLESIWIEGCKSVGENFLDALESMETLATLQISESEEIKANGLDTLAELPAMTSLSLIGCVNLSNKGLRHVALCENLESFTFSSDQVTDGGLQHFTSMKKLTTLSGLMYCKQVSEQKIESLRKALPNCSIS